MYTDSIIDELIGCSKKVVEGWRETKDARHGLKKTITLTSEDGEKEFSVFLTQNAYFPEDFSVGLVYNSKTEDGKLCVIRVNGLHGVTDKVKWGHHAYTHLHKVSAEEINKGNKQPVIIKETKEYTTLESAIEYVGKLFNVRNVDRVKHFPSVINFRQQRFFDN